MLHSSYKVQLQPQKQLNIVSEGIVSQVSSFSIVVIHCQGKALPFPFYTDVVVNISPISWWKALRSYG